MTTLGPGTLKIGDVGSQIDASCLVNNARIVPSKDQGDSKTMLCGTVKPGSITYTYALSGSVDIDATDAAGLFALSNAQPGSQQPFEFVPNTADGTSAKGILVLDPLEFGADDFGDPLDSDFEFELVGPPVYTFPEGGGFTAAKGPLVVNGAPATAAPTVVNGTGQVVEVEDEDEA